MQTVVDGPDPLLGAKVAGRYTVMRRIAKGGMGVVYMAVQDGLGRTVALKIIRREAASDPVMQKRFEREAKAASALSHPAIVTVYDYGKTDDGALFLAMEFVDGEALRDVINRKKRLSFAESVPIIEAIAQGLLRAHASGVVHRDLKPENIMLPRQSASTTGMVVAKVLDFGLAKPHDPDQVGENLTRDGGFVGTPGYCAPEQAEGAPEHPRQDLYALGVVWFELLVGEHPFAAPTPMKRVVRQMNEEPPDLDALHVEGVPHEAAELIRALMARNPERRPESAQAVLDAIHRWRATPPLAMVAPAPAISAPGSPPHKVTVAEGPARAPESQSGRGSAPLFVIAGGALAAAAGFLAVWLARPDDVVATPDAGATTTATVPDLVVPAAPVLSTLIIEHAPSFLSVKTLKDALAGELGTAIELVTFTPASSTLRLPAAPAQGLADRLQGRALQSELPLVLEVKELSAERVVVAAVRPEDASALPDAGLLLDGGALADAGALEGVVAPGGLAP
ncbi:MAG: serine/threonine protein kinase [Deltaproteobacteria bacterium]|nr:serine/threonine protein kinase [Deltaproteobacteria bacterium]